MNKRMKKKQRTKLYRDIERWAKRLDDMGPAKMYMVMVRFENLLDESGDE